MLMFCCISYIIYFVLYLPFKGKFLVSYVNKRVLMYNLEMDEAYK